MMVQNLPFLLFLLRSLALNIIIVVVVLAACVFQCRMMNHQQFPTGPTPPLTSGTTLNTSDPSAPTTTSTRWPEPSSPTSTSETLWDMRPMRDMNTERRAERTWEEEGKATEDDAEIS